MIARIALVALTMIVAGTTASAQTCSEHLLVSGYFSNNVAIYNACSGAFLRQMETAGRIQGPQAVRLNPLNDLIYVVSEGNDQIQRYRRNSTYDFVDVFAQLASNVDPTGIAFGANGEVYVASYSTSSVLELNPINGQQVRVILPSTSGLFGADNGMMISATGLLYVPGYDSSSVARSISRTARFRRSSFHPAARAFSIRAASSTKVRRSWSAARAAVRSTGSTPTPALSSER